MTDSLAARSTILICGPSPRAVGGGPAHVRSLLASPLAHEFRLELFETGSRGRESPARDEPLPATLVRLLVSPFALAARLFVGWPAVVHLNTAVDPRGFWREVVLVAVARAFGRRVVYQIHGGSLARLTAPPLMRTIARATFAGPDAVVVLARTEQEQFERLGGVRRLVVVPNAIDVAALAVPGGRAHSGEVRRLGYLGRLVDGKGLFETLEAVATLRAEPAFASLEWRIAGTGDARARLEAEIARRGLQGAVRLVGPLQGAEKARFLQESDVFLLPSESEGMPYAVLEAMAAGTPVVASRVGGIPDVVGDGEHGRLVPPRDAGAIAGALRALAGSPERLREISRACEARAAGEFGLDRLARQFAALYRELGAR
jgi:glycosyltransferase involved in cell wall biosynthesis